MRLVQDLTYKQVGKEMGFTLERGRQLYHKGINMVEEYVDKK